MKLAAYGTLKEGYGNNRLLADATFVEERTIKGFKLFNSGFPVAAHSPDDSIIVEIYDIGEVPNSTLRACDWLENEGRMYHRTEINEKEDIWMYVGHDDFWQFDTMTEVKPREDGVYEWSR